MPARAAHLPVRATGLPARTGGRPPPPAKGAPATGRGRCVRGSLDGRRRGARACQPIPLGGTWRPSFSNQTPGHPMNARRSFAALLFQPAPPPAPAAFTAAIEDAGRELAALSPRVPGVIINLKGPEGARVTLDGAE